ncbi:Hypothetical protein AA314_06070 [Archangium gephyra]|uniref:Uncharacterized protein n=1 Tax=Archangium gephyra TaxID=48 RepID=A0AAC8QBK7_9BACT|nr:Hypothetical protein AA314_06070 [Archangium gephyra]
MPLKSGRSLHQQDMRGGVRHASASGPAPKICTERSTPA